METRICESCASLLEGFMERIAACVELLSDEQIWWRPNTVTNSVGNHLLHVQGNLSQWVLAAMGGVTYQRHRSREFSADHVADKAQLLRDMRRVTEHCVGVVRRLTTQDLERRHVIQGKDVDGVYAVIHAMEHASYHTGQIVHITKELLGPEAHIEFFPQHRHE